MKYEKLKNKKNSTILVNQNGLDYYLEATAEDKQVGFCKFNIAIYYTKQLGEDYRKKASERKQVSIDQIPTEKDFKVANPKNCIIKNKSVVLPNGKEYPISYKTCELQQIEILDEKYFNVGLGSIMLKLMEEIALKENCEKIEAIFVPNGKFSHAALGFYKRNKFKFIQENSSMICLEKEL